MVDLQGVTFSKFKCDFGFGIGDSWVIGFPNPRSTVTFLSPCWTNFPWQELTQPMGNLTKLLGITYLKKEKIEVLNFYFMVRNDWVRKDPSPPPSQKKRLQKMKSLFFKSLRHGTVFAFGGAVSPWVASDLKPSFFRLHLEGPHRGNAATV